MNDELALGPFPPPPLRSIGISGLRGIFEIIYGLQQLTGKILGTLDLWFGVNLGHIHWRLHGRSLLRLNFGSVGMTPTNSFFPKLRLGHPCHEQGQPVVLLCLGLKDLSGDWVLPPNTKPPSEFGSVEAGHTCG
jgi:hypothetical protein